MASTTVEGPVSASPAVQTREERGSPAAVLAVSRPRANLPTGSWRANGGAGLAKRPLATHCRSGSAATVLATGAPGTPSNVRPVHSTIRIMVPYSPQRWALTASEGQVMADMRWTDGVDRATVGSADQFCTGCGQRLTMAASPGG